MLTANTLMIFIVCHCQREKRRMELTIPVVMISYNSANVLTTATVTPEMTQEEVVNHGMPERVRLYAGGDRPILLRM
jgi:hypothetical protein